MTSKYFTPPAALQPNTTARSGSINSDFTAVDAAFQGVAADMLKTLSHATLTLTPLSQTATQMAGKVVSLDSTGLNLVCISSLGTWQGNWVTATQYHQGDLVQAPTAPFSIYYATQNFTSGASVAADVTSGFLVLAVNLSNLPFALPVSVQNASFTAVVGNLYITNNGSAAIAVTLPAGAALTAGPSSVIAFSISNFTGSITLDPNGTDKINGVNTNTIFYNNEGHLRGGSIYWSGATNGWITI